MTEQWEDWECDDFVLNDLNINQEKEKEKEKERLMKERKLVEESDHLLTEDLFSNSTSILKSKVDFNPSCQKMLGFNKIVSNKGANELKQKTVSMQSKQCKKMKQKMADIFGEVLDDDDDKYAEYEDKFYG